MQQADQDLLCVTSKWTLFARQVMCEMSMLNGSKHHALQPHSTNICNDV